MFAVGIAGLLLGYVLGLRYRVFVLVPVEIIASATCGTAILTGSIPGTFGLELLTVFSAGVQLSYFAALARPVMARRSAGRPAEA